MKILVTGATGFIGAHFVNLAAENNHEVHAVRRNNSSSARIKIHDKVTWINKTLEDVEVEDFQGVEALVHFAAKGVPPQPVEINELCTFNSGTQTDLIYHAIRAGIKRIAIAGTVAEYGIAGQMHSPLTVSTPLMPVSYYAASKVVGFYRAIEIAKIFDVGMFYGRISSAYGPGQYVGNLWPSLLQAVKTGSDFNMTTGRQVRDFIPVGAVAEVFLDAITKQDLDKPLLHVENVASGKSRTVEEWVASWWERLRAKGKINLGAIKESEFDIRCLNPSVSANISKIAARHLKLNA